MEENKPSSDITNPLLTEVKAERERLEKARDEAKKEADRLEQLRADQLLSGVAGVRKEVVMVSPEEEAKKRALDYWKGSMIEEAIAKHG